jgi:hypothetical protein
MAKMMTLEQWMTARTNTPQAIKVALPEYAHLWDREHLGVAAIVKARIIKVIEHKR